MFTGIVVEVGAITARIPKGPGARLTIACGFPGLVLGESIAVSGVCLTVDKVVSGPLGGFEADASAETLSKTTLDRAQVGSKVNLERALRADDRLGGHFVAGHVDGTGKLLGRTPVGDSVQLRFELPSTLARYVATKGSITVDGVSLTVNEVDGGGADGEHSGFSFQVVIVPHTLRKTTIADLAVGARVNLEVDVLARYVARQMELGQGPAREGGSDEDAPIVRALRGAGYL